MSLTQVAPPGQDLPDRTEWEAMSPLRVALLPAEEREVLMRQAAEGMASVYATDADLTEFTVATEGEDFCSPRSGWYVV